MTWIKTISFDDDERLRRRGRAAGAYPVEYGTTTHPPTGH